MVFSQLQNENLWAMRDMFKSMDQQASAFIHSKKYEEATFELEKAAYSIEERKLWESPSSEGLRQCINHPRSYKGPKATPNGYIMVNANGGLNQMRDGVFTTSFFMPFT